MVRRLSIPFAQARLLRVTARLQSGVIAPTVFPLPLDGIAASAARRRRLGGSYGKTVDHHVESLPLVRSPTRCTGRRWVWAATCALGLDGSLEDLRWWHGRTDMAAAERVVERLPADLTVGRFKAVRIPQTVSVVAAVEWLALGDRDALGELLETVISIGKRRGSGEGRVLGWTVSDVGGPEWEPIMWTDDGHVARPFPARAAGWLGVDAPETIVVDAYRPPYWRRPPTAVNGRFARLGVEVIAPWVRRP